MGIIDAVFFFGKDGVGKIDTSPLKENIHWGLQNKTKVFTSYHVCLNRIMFVQCLIFTFQLPTAHYCFQIVLDFLSKICLNPRTRSINKKGNVYKLQV